MAPEEQTMSCLSHYTLTCYCFYLLLKDFLSNVLTEADRGRGAVVPQWSQAVIGWPWQPLRHQQFHISCTVGHQKLICFSLSR